MPIDGIVSKSMIRLFLLLLHVTLSAATLHIDTETALMWQDVPENRGTLYTWDEAKAYCEELDLENYDDWWLPSEAELVTIVDTSRPKGRMIKKGFIYYKGKPYWTSSTYSWNAPEAWVISFNNGASYSEDKHQSLHVRCMRCSDFKVCIEKFYSL
ncbi:MAG: DUF1566 domain-containing protein [Campylobacterota bacterium]|nr:DUF1566 domain-containing protein [Campylobacterota bacterium]